MGWKGGKFEAHQCRYLGWTYLRWIGGFFLGSFLKKRCLTSECLGSLLYGAYMVQVSGLWVSWWE